MFNQMRPFMDDEKPSDFEDYFVGRVQLSGTNATTISVITNDEYTWIPLEKTVGLEQVASDQGCTRGIVPKSLFVCHEWLKFCLSYFDRPEATCRKTDREHCAFHPVRPICVFFLTGKCKHGPKCDKLHLIDCTLKEPDEPEISAETYFSNGRVIPSAMPTVQIKPREQKAYTRRNHQMCLAHLCGMMQGRTNACTYGTRCNFAHSAEQLEYIYKNAEKAFTQFIISADKTIAGEDASGFFQNTYEELNKMFVSNRDIIRQIILRGRVANKITVSQLDSITIERFQDMLRFWFSLATIVRNQKKRGGLARQIKCDPEDLPTLQFTKWEDLVWALARRSLSTCGGYMTMMEIAGDGSMSRQLNYNWSSCCRSGIYCTRGTHPHENYIKDDISYVVDFAEITTAKRETLDYEKQRKELQQQLDDAKKEYALVKEKFKETQEASKSGSRFVRVGEIKELSERLSKIKATIYQRTSAKHRLFRKCNPCEFGFAPIHEPVSENAVVPQCIVVPPQFSSPDCSRQIVSYDPRKARDAILSTGNVSLYATAAKSSKLAIEEPKKAPKPVLRSSPAKSAVVLDPPKESQSKPKRIIDEDGFETITETHRQRLGKRSKPVKKSDFDITQYITLVEVASPTINDTYGQKTIRKRHEELALCVEPESESESEDELDAPAELVSEQKRTTGRRFWDFADGDSDSDDDVCQSTNIFASSGLSRNSCKLRIHHAQKKLYISGFDTDSSVCSSLKKQGYTIKISGSDCIIVFLKKLTFGRPQAFIDFMNYIHSFLMDADIRITGKDIQNDTPWSLPTVFYNSGMFSTNDKCELDTRLIAVEQKKYTHYIKKHRETVKKRTTKSTLVGPFTAKNASLIATKLSDEGHVCSVTQFKGITFEVKITPPLQKGKTEVRDTIIDVIPTVTHTDIKIE